MILSPLDDYPVHQIAEPMRHVGTSDRNFYDRYYFNAFPLPGTMLLVGLGQYPNLGVTDAFALLRRGGSTGWCARPASSAPTGWTRRSARSGRGPGRPARLRVMLRPERVRPVLRPDLGRPIPPQVEPQHFIRAHERVLFDTMPAGADRPVDRDRTGGRRRALEVTPSAGGGSGTGPGGSARSASPSPRASRPRGLGTFYWLYAPMQFEDHSILCIVQEDQAGRRLLEEAVRVWPDGSRESLGRPC